MSAEIRCDECRKDIDFGDDIACRRCLAEQITAAEKAAYERGLREGRDEGYERGFEAGRTEGALGVGEVE